MTEKDYYPEGTYNDPDAPWNHKDNPEREIEVTVSITLSKTLKIKVSDYQIIDSGIDECGGYFEDIDYSECNLKEAVDGQILLPHKIYDYLAHKTKRTSLTEKELNTIKDLEGWSVDDFEVFKDN